MIVMLKLQDLSHSSRVEKEAARLLLFNCNPSSSHDEISVFMSDWSTTFVVENHPTSRANNKCRALTHAVGYYASCDENESGRCIGFKRRRVSMMDLILLPLKLTLSPMEDISTMMISSERCICSKLVRHTLFLQLLAPHPSVCTSTCSSHVPLYHRCRA